MQIPSQRPVARGGLREGYGGGGECFVEEVEGW